MNGRGGDAPPEASGGQFLLQLLQKPPHHSPPPPLLPPLSESPSLDPAVAAVGPPISPFYQSSLWGAHHHHHLPFAPHVFFPQNPNPSFLSSSPPGFCQNPIVDLSRSGNREVGGLFNGNVKGSVDGVGNGRGCNGSDFRNVNHANDNRNLRENLGGVLEGGRGSDRNSRGNWDGVLEGGGGSNQNLRGNLGCELERGRRSNQNLRGNWDGELEGGIGSNRNLRGNFNGELERGKGINPNLQGNLVGELEGGRGSNQNQRGGSYRAVVPPPGFVSRLGTRGDGERVGNFGKVNFGEIGLNSKDGGELRSTNRTYEYNGRVHNDRAVGNQLEVGGLDPGSRFNPVALSDLEESMMKLHAQESRGRDMSGCGASQKMKESSNHSRVELDDLEDQLASSLGIDEESEGISTKEKAKGSRDKDYRADKRGKWILGQRIRIMKRKNSCRRDIDMLSAPFLAIYESLIPPKEEKEKQEKLLTILRSIVKKDWPEAQLYVYGSCANSFGFSKSDIDICLVIQNMDINKSEVLLKLAESLESNNFQNVQALTRARVPIVKLMDPDTGISCDICINNILAVVNTKLLHDYARIDVRLRQLAFIVKHWAKTRGVNETYQGTLSSYAYVLMCINFLQQRKPAILPCLQGMEPTYSVTVENTECAYFNEVDKLYGFGAQNGETISHLVWAFFNYWAYYHDYTNDVISVRTGSTLSKQAKDWTRRIGNDRHLICIEDPFELTHDLGRVVDKASIRVLREEFERAAEIMQHEYDPCTKLFEPYVPQ